MNRIFFVADEPGQPGRPNILDWGPNHCDLSWAPPETDGGAPITHYVIELKVGRAGQNRNGRIIFAFRKKFPARDRDLKIAFFKSVFTFDNRLSVHCLVDEGIFRSLAGAKKP